MTYIQLFFKLAVGLLLTTVPASAQTQLNGFVIDSTKAYAYLELDHRGVRKRLPSDTTDRGLWLRLVNNSRVPLVVATFDPGTGDPGVGVYDEVVAAAPRGPRLHLGEMKSGVSHARTKTPRPSGYPLRDVFSTARVLPGESLLFSVPANHVGPGWTMQIRFYLSPAGAHYGSGPYSVLSFDMADIPPPSPAK